MKKGILLLAVFTTALWGCTEHPSIRQQLEQTQTLIRTHPDSALRLIRSIDPKYIVKRSNKAQYALLYAQALDKNYIDVTQDTLIRIAANYYLHHGTAIDKARAFYYSGRVYENAGNIDTAVMQFLRAEEFAGKTDDEYLKGLLYNAMAGAYTCQQFRALARDNYVKSADCFLKIGHTFNALKSYNGAVNSSLLLKDYVHAEEYLRITEKLIAATDDPKSILIDVKNRAKLLIGLHSDYRTVLRMLQNAYATYNNGYIPASHYYILSNLYIHLNKPDSAWLYLKPQLASLQSETPRAQAEMYYLAGKYMESIGKYALSARYNEQSLKLIDSLYFAEKEIAIPELCEKYRNDQLLLKNHYLKLLNRHQFVVALLIILCILGICCWLINLRHKKILQQNRKLKEYENAVNELRSEYEQLREIQDSNANGRDGDYLCGILERRRNFLRQMLEVTATYEYDKELHYAKIKEFLTKDSRDHNNMTAIFRDMVNAKHPGLLHYMKAKYPELTEQDIDLYCLVCMDLTVSAICLVLGHKPKTIYNYRNLLRRKLNIQNEDIRFQEHYTSLCAEFESRKTSNGISA